MAASPGGMVPTREEWLLHRDNWLLHTLAGCRRTSFCSRGILTPPLEDAVRNRGYGYFSDKLLGWLIQLKFTPRSRGILTALWKIRGKDTAATN